MSIFIAACIRTGSLSTVHQNLSRAPIQIEQVKGKFTRVSGACTLHRDWQTSGEPEEACVNIWPMDVAWNYY